MKKYLFLSIVAILLICLIPQFGLSAKAFFCIEAEKEKETSENERFEFKEHYQFAHLRDNFASSHLPRPLHCRGHSISIVIAEKPLHIFGASSKFFNHSPPDLV